MVNLMGLRHSKELTQACRKGSENKPEQGIELGSLRRGRVASYYSDGEVSHFRKAKSESQCERVL